MYDIYQKHDEYLLFYIALGRALFMHRLDPGVSTNRHFFDQIVDKSKSRLHHHNEQPLNIL